MSSPKDESKGFAAMFAESEQNAPKRRARRPQVGDEVSGPVVSISAESVFIDLGGKAEGILDRADVTDDDDALQVAVGDTVRAKVINTKDGTILLRKGAGRGQAAAAQLADAFEHKMALAGTISGVNKGGVEVDIGGVRAFCPVSQLATSYVEDPASYVGQQLDFRITRYEPGPRPNVVVSHRAILEEANALKAAELRKTLAAGSVVRGTVTTIKPYGAFVDLGGLEGMLHVSQLGFGRIEDPSEVLAVGASIEVQVLDIKPNDDPKRPERISLSLKSLQEDPFDAAAKQLTPGSKHKGAVSRLEAFGAFVKLPAGIEGLVHVSELLANRRINHPREVVTVGDEVEVVVLSLDHDRKRVSLSMKAVAAQTEAAQAANFKRAPQGSLGTFGDLLKGKLKK